MKEKFGVITVVSLFLAVLGVVAPISWDYYTGQKSITLTAIAQNSVISPSISVDGLEISYKGTPLTTLSRNTFLIENTGSKSLLQSDVVAPIEVKVSEGVTVFDAMVESKQPDNLDILLSKQANSVLINFTLLNPGDQVLISLLTDSNTSSFTAAARIAGVKELTVLDEPPKTLTMWAIIWIPVATFSGLLILISIVGFVQFPQEFRVKRALRLGRLNVPDFHTYEDAHQWIEKTLSFTTKKERQLVFRLLAKLEEEGIGFDSNRILNEICLVVKRSHNNFIMAIFVSGIGFFGLSYALTSLGYF
ncbi:TPA: hypothetical protein ACN33E_002857 [Vibrio parahaemolyticus]|nr:hypothetical protein [Vibrio parahaemolyticus]EJG1691263.1 hypothetical protein [Vibrio parahaemolyticus]MBE3709959.1 hypothetical protein [Vibrio parahaemolyticus]MBE4259146.1 hypothetical protein [Vibrio parahaemolyticus]HAS6663122.1 hypothetical protein [Vibrio parahaemolyticus]